jgi:LPXTG-motif cell wall-anchored protein
LPPNNIDYIGLQLEKTNGCYLPVTAYVSDIKAYKTITLADKTVLDSAIMEANALKQADYLADSWTVFASALTAAKTVAADTDATAQEITKAVDDLKTAKSALKTVPQSSGESSQVSSVNSEESNASSSTASQESSDSSDTPKTGDSQVSIVMMAALLSTGGILATRRKTKPSRNT